MMRILFLDIDDVICLWKQYDKPRHLGEVPKFDSKAVLVLNQIILETNCELVVCSDWRFHMTLRELQQVFTNNKVVTVPIDITPKICYGDCKAEEIKKYVAEHLPDKWAVVDDLPLPIENFVQCPRINEGIKQTGIKAKLIQFLL